MQYNGTEFTIQRIFNCTFKFAFLTETPMDLKYGVHHKIKKIKYIEFQSNKKSIIASEKRFHLVLQPPK